MVEDEGSILGQGYLWKLVRMSQRKLSVVKDSNLLATSFHS